MVRHRWAGMAPVHRPYYLRGVAMAVRVISTVRGMPHTLSSPLGSQGRRLDWGRWAITCNDPEFKGQGNPDTGEGRDERAVRAGEEGL